jgi:hypothetical protein
MRDLSALKNIVEIQDGISGDVHEIHYRNPSVEEMAGYQNGLFERRGRKLRNKIFENRLKYGGRIITGFEKGSFGCDGKPLASDPSDPDYREDWKEQLVKNAPDVVCAVAMVAFESTGVSREAELEGPLDE